MQNIIMALRQIMDSRQKGVTTVEYAVMLVLVAIAVAGFGVGLSGSVTGVFSAIITALGPAGP